jgi:multiple antibiotic resistance protein
MAFDYNFLLSLLSIINPLGTVPLFIELTKNQTERRRIIAAKSALYTALILFIFYYFGPALLKFFSISISGLQLAGGIIVAISGYAMIEGKFEKHKGLKKKNIPSMTEFQDPSLLPIAMPMLAGPGSISFLIKKNLESDFSFAPLSNTIISIILCSALIFLVFGFSHYITKYLTEQGIRAFSRFVGFFIMAIGAEMVIGVVKTITL